MACIPVSFESISSFFACLLAATPEDSPVDIRTMPSAFSRPRLHRTWPRGFEECLTVSRTRGLVLFLSDSHIEQSSVAQLRRSFT
ncbi:hypothetical protein Mp_8g04180 [Marchantia polymorpha subsp. ruderalis]|uniref:Uncharacterized protein n=1 Tax=Marchantia polymorpha TaxID=3197 RepID=A0A2R6XJJ6_MARPO|nr:hypothetical protein MARPO_0012s0207 [Marchantia polymorpha]BBN18641.1 hypothetical protein Mp_8g04180 [Marchantia polymorpha subsp. ruderalis]|eukprot:PTQ46288.1 hypothetical protein MARPO_0012s0207 [Marchantia polymorpha]